ncbi:MAG: hypothetical protein HZA61_12750 [Candidatus Eisenbacteria bacterium]|uniref:DUF2946 domain-containing protein n=1 Tax=Eiseniibacteriota bacterium TaxID=2212470 RepID=A0A933W2R5_UNCEI|nr:hypothetical protein [Candidatus Eisenbacteria bacterium]
MKLPLFAIRRLPRALGAILLVATLVLGAAAHVWHHVADPHCGESAGSGHGEHYCGACTNLPGGTLAAGDAPAPAPALVAWAGFAAPVAHAPAAAPRTSGAPRAPPAA